MAVQPNDPRMKSVGFCKLLGESIEHYAQKYEINIGRKSKATNLDVVIGDTNISRQHACIAYNFSKGAWELRVFGKNGVTVKNTIYTPNSPPVTLQSGDLLQLGDKAFFFLLDKGARDRYKDLKKPKAAGVSKPRQKAPTIKILMSGADKVPEAKQQQQSQLPNTEAIPAASAALKPLPHQASLTQTNPASELLQTTQNNAKAFSSASISATPQPPLSAQMALQSKDNTPLQGSFPISNLQHNPAAAAPGQHTGSRSLEQRVAPASVPQQGGLQGNAQQAAQLAALPKAQPQEAQRVLPQKSSLPQAQYHSAAPPRPTPQATYAPLSYPGPRAESVQPSTSLPGYTLGLSGTGQPQGAPSAALTSAALQQLNLQALIKAHQQQQAQQQAQQALQRAGQSIGVRPSQPQANVSSGSTAVPSVLQQLMTANSAVNAEHGTPRQANPMFQIPNYQGYQQNNAPHYSLQALPRQMLPQTSHPGSGPIPSYYSSSNPMQPATTNAGNRIAPAQLFPDGFPNQLLQGLEQHQYLQQHLPWDMHGTQKGGNDAPDHGSAQK